MGVLRRRVSTKTDWEPIDKADFIGPDEISLKKGHKDFVTVVSALSGDDLTVLAILKGREKNGKRFSENHPEKNKEKTERRLFGYV
ncbi:hypothetical protein DENIS_1811 [Desulfonema ishimotonii]|uniref:Uncharacterized protein n=1 Tax=Desulfonema ishimotonii TaxID=45657 RepID=A0A401FV50_9BACT|nr:transposase [Desulfonema ishimotonii]GBC60852.1 hypothetical protein DENIS_1811 [Desulfonema ishimotonii]